MAGGNALRVLMGRCLEVRGVKSIITRDKKRSGARIFSAVFFCGRLFYADFELGWS